MAESFFVQEVIQKKSTKQRNKKSQYDNVPAVDPSDTEGNYCTALHNFHEKKKNH